MKIYCWNKMEVVQSVAELLDHSDNVSPLTMTITPEKSGDFYAVIAITGLLEEPERVLDWNTLGRLVRT